MVVQILCVGEAKTVCDGRCGVGGSISNGEKKKSKYVVLRRKKKECNRRDSKEVGKRTEEAAKETGCSFYIIFLLSPFDVHSLLIANGLWRRVEDEGERKGALESKGRSKGGKEEGEREGEGIYMEIGERGGKDGRKLEGGKDG